MDTTTSPTPTSAKPDSTKTKAAAAKAGNPQVGDYKTPLLNPLWAAEVVKSYDLTGKLAERVAAALAVAVEKQLTKVNNREKLTKLVKAAIDENIGKDKS